MIDESKLVYSIPLKPEEWIWVAKQQVKFIYNLWSVRCAFDRDDLVSEATYALVRGCNKLNKTKKYKDSIVGYLIMCCKHQLRSYVRVCRRFERAIEYYDHDSGMIEDYPDPVSTERHSDSYIDVEEMMRLLNDSLTPREREVLAGYVAGEGLNTMATRLGMSKSNLWNKLANVKHKARFLSGVDRTDTRRFRRNFQSGTLVG